MDQHSFLFQAMIYLAAAVITVPFAKKTGLGSVLGYLIAGFIIGPAVLGFIGHEGEDIMHFAEFGVVMMLFIIGLELEPLRLWKLRRAILGMGGTQVVLTTILIGIVAYLNGLSVSASLALGMILSLSSTAIVLQTLTEKDLLNTDAGQRSFSVLLFQDIAVIPMLAVLPLLGPSAGEAAHADKGIISDLPGWAQTLVTLGAIVLIVIGGKFIIRPLFRIIARTRLREMFTATALLIVISIAVLMTAVGLSAALGTFLAGVVLANSEYRHELESDIEPFKGLLLGLFFIAVGASIDVRLIIEDPLLILSLVAALMLIKAVVLYVIGKMFKMQTDQNGLFAAALCQVGEFAFVLFGITQQQELFTQEVNDIMIAVVAISMAMTPLVLMFFEKVISPRLVIDETDGPVQHDSIDEHNPVIIAGFGHFGNTIGRFLRAHDIGTTILDIDSDRVSLLRKMGFKVYYGDASRPELLASAGAAYAKLIIIAIDDPEKRLELIETIKKHFPELRMLVRAKDRYDAYDQMNAGMLHVYRETVDTALRLGVDAMKFLGFRSYSAERAARTFLKYDELNLKQLSSIRDNEQYITTARELIEDLERTLKADMHERSLRSDDGWDEDTLIAEAGSITVSSQTGPDLNDR